MQICCQWSQPLAAKDKADQLRFVKAKLEAAEEREAFADDKANPPLTDSRSFLSYPRHEYFRLILCNLIGRDVETGSLPQDMELLGNMVKNISFRNADRYFEM